MMTPFVRSSDLAAHEDASQVGSKRPTCPERMRGAVEAALDQGNGRCYVGALSTARALMAAAMRPPPLALGLGTPTGPAGCGDRPGSFLRPAESVSGRSGIRAEPAQSVLSAGGPADLRRNPPTSSAPRPKWSRPSQAER